MPSVGRRSCCPGPSRRSSRCSSSCRSHRRRPHASVSCSQYAQAHVGVVRGDDRRAVRPAGRRPQRRRHHQRADVDDEHRRLHVERGRRRAARHHHAARARRAAVARRSRRSSTWSATATPASTTTGTTTGRARSSPTGRRSPTPNFHPILSSVDNGWLAVGLKIVENSVAAAAHARRRALRRDGLRLLLPAGRQPRALPLPAGRPRRLAVLLRHRRQRESRSSTTSASGAGSCRRRSTTGAGAPSRTPATTHSRRPSRSGRDAQLLRRRRLRGRLSVRRHPARARAGAAACSRR